MEDKKNKILRGQIPTSVFYILFGLCLALMPVETVNVLCKVVFGLVLIGAGVYHILIFVLEKDNSTILDLFSGVIVLVIGIFLFMNPTVVVKLLTLMLGAFILVDSIWMMRGSMKLKKRGQGVWKAFLVESLIFIGLGVLILVNPFSEIRMTVQISGCIFVANGVLDIIFYLILRHGLKKEIQDESAGAEAADGAVSGFSNESEAVQRQNFQGENSLRDGVNEVTEVDADGKAADKTSETVNGTENMYGGKAAETLDNGFEAEFVGSGTENTGNEESQTDQETEEEEVLEEWKD